MSSKINFDFLDNRLCKVLDIGFPLIQAGMGGIATEELASSVANAGCGGVLALYKQSVDEIIISLRNTRKNTNKIFGVNLIPEIVTKSYLLEQVNAVLSAKENIFFTFFGIPPKNIFTLIKNKGYIIAVQVGTKKDAEKVYQGGADILILQGNEAGGHHLGDLSAFELLKQVRKLYPCMPIVVAGGIGTALDLYEYIKAGADGGLCGTLFVPTIESNAHKAYKNKIILKKASDTCITDLFEFGWPGRKHRVLKNTLIDIKEKLPSKFIAQMEINNIIHYLPRYSSVVPTKNTTGSVEEMVMYCGMSCEKINKIKPVVDTIKSFKESYCSIIQNNKENHGK